MWAIALVLFIVLIPQVIPLTCGIGLCSSNCSTHEGGIYFFPHTHTKQKQKEQLKLKAPKKILRKTKEGGKENQEKMIEINKIFKFYKFKFKN